MPSYIIIKNALHSFGFLDGISNPVVDGFDTVINPGPKIVPQGVILTGRPGDKDKDTRAEWAKDGSFLAFRYLFQQVPEFDNFLKKNPIAKDGNGKVLTPEQGSELLGARMVGRWKSGMPIFCPYPLRKETDYFITNHRGPD